MVIYGTGGLKEAPGLNQERGCIFDFRAVANLKYQAGLVISGLLSNGIQSSMSKEVVGP